MAGRSRLREKLACLYFFTCPGLGYGLFVSRMPALKAQTGANEAELGFVLLALGLTSFFGLMCSSLLMSRFGSGKVLRLSSLALLLSLPPCGLASSPLALGFACAALGLCCGLSDVSMNTQAMLLERRLGESCMGVLHAGYNMGCVLGAAAGALFAALGASPLVNFLAVALLCWTPRPWCVPRMEPDGARRAERRAGGLLAVLPPPFVLLCGLVAAFDYATEGSVGEWSALYLFSVKGADEHLAPLGFACFSVASVACRMAVDGLRTRFGDVFCVFLGGLLAFAGMSLALASSRPELCLAGYACMGAGMGPIVPIAFSRAGSLPGVDAARASAAISLLAYGALLVFPPLIGNLAHAFGLHRALFVPLALCGVLTLSSLLFRGGPFSRTTSKERV